MLRTTHHTQYTYNAATEQLKYTDEDSLNTANLIEIYTGWSVPKTHFGLDPTNWNREHTWSKSHGNFGDFPPAGTDLHHLRPCDATVNSAKGNRDFDNGGLPYTDGSPYPGYSGVTGCYSTANTWEPRTEDKGDVARMIFYMAVRYEGTDTDFDLELLDSVPTTGPFYGKLSTLMLWHQQDPPDARERRRNERIYERQGNRNPFIDLPQFAHSVWGQQVGNTRVQFYPVEYTAWENQGSVNLRLILDNPGSTSVNGQIALLSGDAAYLNNYTTQNFSFPAGSISPLNVTVYITDNSIRDINRSFTFQIINLSGGNDAETGTNATCSLTVLNDDYPETTLDLFISEYVEGSSNNKYLEIFNGTGTDINLSDYRLRTYYNGNTSPLNDVLLSGILPSGQCKVYKNSAATLSLPPGVTTEDNTAVNYNGNDAIALYRISRNLNVDIFGIIGNDPGTSWIVNGITTVDKTLRRKTFVSSGVITYPGDITTLGSQWEMFPIDTAIGLGTHTYVSDLVLSAPQNLSIIPELNQVKLTWNPVLHALRYRIYRSTIPNPADWGTPYNFSYEPLFYDNPAGSRLFYRVTAE